MAKITTITNPLTGQPAQVDQLDHTAQQIDDGIARALPGGAIDLALSSKPNPNLLDNWYFANPVDQRGGYVLLPGTRVYSDEALTNLLTTTSKYTAIVGSPTIADGYAKYTNVNGVARYTEVEQAPVRGYTGGFLYTIDRWKLEDSTGRGVVLINDDGSITIKNPEGNTDNIWWTQYRETSFTGEQCTISVLATEASVGSVYTGTNNLGIMLRQGMTTLTGVPTGNMAARIVVSPGNAVTVRGIKLELGGTQTLAHQDADGSWVLNEIPNYGEQLRRCQRYFRRLSRDSVWSVIGFGHNVDWDTTLVEFAVVISERMADGVILSADNIGIAGHKITNIRANQSGDAILTYYGDIDSADGMTTNVLYQVQQMGSGVVDLIVPGLGG